MQRRRSIRRRTPLLQALRVVAVLLPAIPLAAACGGGASPDPDRNLLLISVDTWRGDHLFGSRGGVELTPELSRFAGGALTFDEASSAGNATSAGVTGLLTGLLPRRAGVVRNADRLQEAVPTLATRLREQGFETAAFVANPVLASEHGFAQGFERYELLSRTRRQTKGRAEALSRAALSWLEDRDPSRRFFLWLHYMDPHGPYEPPAPWDGMFRPEAFEERGPVPLLPRGNQSGYGGIPHYQQVAPAGEQPSRDARDYEARYAAEVRSVDAAVGELLADMASRGWLDDTITILTSDHGEALSDDHGYWFSHGHGLTRDQLHVPLLVRCTRCQPGTRVDRPVSTVDVVPTVLELLGLEVPEGLDGHSLLEDRPSPVIGQSPAATSVRDGDWKLTVMRDRVRLSALANDREEPVATESEPERVARLQAALREAQRPGLVEPRKRDSLGPDELESLRVLGYVE